MKTLLLVLAAAGLVLLGVFAAEPIRRGFSAANHAMASRAQPAEAGMPAEADATGTGVTLYQSGMHPWIITTEPGNCPICGMKLEPIDPAKLTGEISIDPVVVQNIGVRTEPVLLGPAVQTLRTVGTVEVAEPNVHDVNLRISGWIEKLFVGYEGAQVQAGDPLFSVYSPQLYAAAEEFLLAVENGSADDPLLGSARDRLLNLGLSPKQVDRIREDGVVERNLAILSPVSGTVVTKHANEGMNVEPGMRVFRIVDLSSVWVQVTLFESQLAGIRPGQPATMTVAGLPGETFDGELSFVDPTLNPTTRSVRARLVFENPGDRLKPGMFADVTLRDTVAEEAVLAPREAVVATGTRKLVFVAKGGGRFEPREVHTAGDVADGRVRIASGLEPGENVVTSGQFLLDSEASVRVSLARMVGIAEDSPAGAAAPMNLPDAARATQTVSPAVQARLDQLAKAYLQAQADLTQNQPAALGPVAQAATALADIAEGPVATLAASVAESADRVPADADLPTVRGAFDPLSQAVVNLFEAAPPTARANEAYAVSFCPMVDKSWLQAGLAIRNPYDPSMLTCGTVLRTLPAPLASPPGSAGEAGEARAEPSAPPPPVAEPQAQAQAQAQPQAQPQAQARPQPQAEPQAQAQAQAEPQPQPQPRTTELAKAYLALQQNLTRDNPAGAAAVARAARSLASKATGPLAQGAAAVAESADRVPADADLATVRGAFQELSLAVIALLDAAGADDAPAGTGSPLAVAHCPMVNRDWLQEGTAIRNPYAPSMLTCGTVVRTLQPGANDAR